MKSITRVEDLPFEKKASYSTAEVADLLGVSSRTVRAWICNGKLFAAPLRAQYRVRPASFMQFLGVPPQIRWTRPKPPVDLEENEEVDRTES